MKKLQLALLFALAWQAVCAQDANYWSNSYGPGGFVVPGATIARNNDSGVLFYNPALLAYNTKNAASISGNIYNFESIKIKDGAGSGFDLKSTNAAIIPQIISNTIYLKLNGKPFSFAYGLIQDPTMRFQVSQRRDDKVNVLDDSYSPGTEYYIGQFTNSNSVSHTSAILSFGKPLGSRLAMGLTLSGEWRKQTLLVDMKSRALMNSGNPAQPPIVNVSQYYLANNMNAGLTVRAGVSYDISSHQHLGLTVDAPQIHMYSQADLLSDVIVNNLKLGNDTLYVLANARQTGLKSKWRMPFSVALGYSIDYERGQIYLALQYFAPVSLYNIITPRTDYFIRPDTGLNAATPSLLKMVDERKAILNVAAAFSYRLKESLTCFASFRTDFNNAGSANLYSVSDGYRYNTASWDIYHLELGANTRKRKFNLRTGLFLSYAHTNDYAQAIDFSDPKEDNLLLGQPGVTKAGRFSAGVFISYIHNL